MVGRIRTVLVVACLTVFFFVALLLLLQMAPWEPLREFAEKAIGRRWVASEEGMIAVSSGESQIAIGAVVQAGVLIASLVIIVAVGVVSLQGLRDRIHITKEGEDGSVTIVESAITRYIKQVALDIDSVQTVRSVIKSTNEGLVVDLRTRVLVTETLPRIERAIRERVRVALEETLGVGGVAAINVIIEDFEKAASPPAQAAGAEARVELVGQPAPAAEETGVQWTPLFRRTTEEEPSEPETTEEETVEEEPEVEGDRSLTAGAESADDVAEEEPPQAETPEPAATEEEHVESKPWTQTAGSRGTEEED